MLAVITFGTNYLVCLVCLSDFLANFKESLSLLASSESRPTMSRAVVFFTFVYSLFFSNYYKEVCLSDFLANFKESLSLLASSDSRPTMSRAVFFLRLFIVRFFEIIIRRLV